VKYLILAITSAAVIALDQWTKHLVHTSFRWGQTIPVLDPVFALTYVRNQGAAFGLLHRAPPWFRDPFFVVVPVVALFVIFFLIARLPRSQSWTAVALSLILGGAVGNLIDRLRYGFVIDFLDLHWREIYHWPAFNIADSCIVVGVTVMFVQSLFAPAPVVTPGPSANGKVF
jgi:signal peptidase II